MREIKFRAWDKKWQRWIAPEDIEVHGDGTADFVRRGDNGDKIEIADLRECALMQYTGLKDKNGREIYEGDIVQQGQYPYLVEWKSEYDEEFGIMRCGFEIYCIYPELIEIVGNICENPELVKP